MLSFLEVYKNLQIINKKAISNEMAFLFMILILTCGLSLFSKIEVNKDNSCNG
jgi:hypothetical protein